MSSTVAFCSVMASLQWGSWDTLKTNHWLNCCRPTWAHSSLHFSSQSFGDAWCWIQAIPISKERVSMWRRPPHVFTGAWDRYDKPQTRKVGHNKETFFEHVITCWKYAIVFWGAQPWHLVHSMYCAGLSAFYRTRTPATLNKTYLGRIVIFNPFQFPTFGQLTI